MNEKKLKRLKAELKRRRADDKQKDWREYDFAIRSYHQIDGRLISKDLSIQEPMMILESDERPGYYLVFLHDSIWTKADNSGPTFETSWQGDFVYMESRYTERLENYLSNCGHGYAWVPQRFLAGLIRLVKEIKNAEWREPTKANCKVRRIKI